jgi:predicted RNA binding protein YcfA (HicA-like mRNA interferase family)
MGRLGNISGKETTRAFGKAGWQVVGQVGSHVVMTKSGVRANLSIPQHKELSTGRFDNLSPSTPAASLPWLHAGAC